MNQSEREKLSAFLDGRSAVRRIYPEESKCVIEFADGARLAIGAKPSIVHDIALTYTMGQWIEETVEGDN